MATMNYTEEWLGKDAGASFQGLVNTISTISSSYLYLGGSAAVLIATFSCFLLAGRGKLGAQRPVVNGYTVKDKTESQTGMTISEIYVYPIKSLRGFSLPSATITKQGFSLDRRYMLLKVHNDEQPRRLENMQVSKIPSMCLFHTSIHDGILTVTYHAPGRAPNASLSSIDIPLQPSSCQALDVLKVEMYGSPTPAYDMGSTYNTWFTTHFGFPVALAYIGGNARPVLGNLVPTPPKTPLASIPVLSRFLLGTPSASIAFNDVAPFLVVTRESCAEVTTRLPAGEEMDITKFRANIILSGSPAPYDEDFWGSLRFGDSEVTILLTANCGRCVSLNVDYQTGLSGTGNGGKGEVLKLLMKDRRVDLGSKWSPVFGRYGFVRKEEAGKVLRVGDGVVVGERLRERSKFYWPGLST